MKDLGNNTPDIIRRINAMIFNTLMNLVTGQKEIDSALRDLCDEIPWDELEMLDEETCSWFSAGEYICLVQF